MTIPGTPTHFPNGLSDVDVDDNILGAMGQLDPTKFQTYFDDFIDYLGPVGTLPIGASPLNNWASSGAAGGEIEYTADADLEGNVACITGGTTDDDVFLIRTPLNMFSLNIGREMWFKVQVQAAEAGNANYIIGLADLASFDPDDGIYFQNVGDNDIWNLILRDGGGEVTSADIDVTGLFRWTFGFYWNGVDRITYAVDEVPIGGIDIIEDFLPSPVMVPMFGAETKSDDARTLRLNYIFAAQPRI